MKAIMICLPKRLNHPTVTDRKKKHQKDEILHSLCRKIDRNNHLEKIISLTLCKRTRFMGAVQQGRSTTVPKVKTLFNSAENENFVQQCRKFEQISTY